eukprot:gene16908-biopygen2280
MDHPGRWPLAHAGAGAAAPLDPDSRWDFGALAGVGPPRLPRIPGSVFPRTPAIRLTPTLSAGESSQSDSDPDPANLKHSQPRAGVRPGRSPTRSDSDPRSKPDFPPRVESDPQCSAPDSPTRQLSDPPPLRLSDPLTQGSPAWPTSDDSLHLRPEIVRPRVASTLAG